jgi:hypothetical protein
MFVHIILFKFMNKRFSPGFDQVVEAEVVAALKHNS